MKIGKVFNQFVILKQDPPSAKSSLGLKIPDGGINRANSGEIVASREEFMHKVGDRVLFQKQAASAIVIDSEEFIVVREVDVYCSLE